MQQRALHQVHLRSRFATRVRVRMGRFRATTLDGLAREVVRLPWRQVVVPRQALEVSVSASRSRLHHRERVARKVRFAVRDALRGSRSPRRRGPPPPAQQVLVRIVDDEVQVSVDASGEPLYRRGWRTDIGAAPLRETLAAATLELAGWTPDEALVDPMCGSGTFVLEAAARALGHAPGAHRRFAFEHWPCHDARGFDAAQREARKRRAGHPPVLWGSDRDRTVVEAARANARRARVSRHVRLEVLGAADLHPPEGPPGLVVANPPWGERIKGVAAPWSDLGSALRARFGGWRVAVLVPRRPLLRHLGLDLAPVAQFPSGGIRISVCTGRVPRTPTSCKST